MNNNYVSDRETELENELFVEMVKNVIIKQKQKAPEKAEATARRLLDKYRCAVVEAESGSYLMAQEVAGAICDMIGNDEDAVDDLLGADADEFVDMVEEAAEESFLTALDDKTN